MRCIKTGANILVFPQGMVRHGDLFQSKGHTFILRATKEHYEFKPPIEGEAHSVTHVAYLEHVFYDNYETLVLDSCIELAAAVEAVDDMVKRLELPHMPVAMLRDLLKERG